MLVVLTESIGFMAARLCIQAFVEEIPSCPESPFKEFSEAVIKKSNL